MSRKRNNPAAFTLIELLVVVAIIVALIALLVPALGQAKRRARITECTAQLSGLSSNIEAYYQVFNAYPGPATAAQTTANTLTGTQNLLLGLSYAMKGVNTGMTAPQTLPLGGTYYVDAASPTAVNDYANFTVNPPGSPVPPGIIVPHSYSAFFTAMPKDLSPATTPNGTAWYPGGISGVNGTPWTFPTIIDHFTDPLPILYYRKAVGVDGIGTATAGAISAQGSPAIVAATGSTNASYFLAENAAYTDATAKLVSPTGTVFPQTGALNANQLATDVAQISPSNSAVARGSYVLIGAGPDRLYGTADDIVLVGGQ